MKNWIDQLLPIIKEYKDGNQEPLDADGVDDLVKIIKAKINFQEGNITNEEYEAILDGKPLIILTEIHNSDVKNVTEEQKDQLVDLDLVWFDGGKWTFSHCKAFEDFFTK